MLIVYQYDLKKENYKWFREKLMQKHEEKYEDWDSSLNAQDKLNALSHSTVSASLAQSVG